MLDNNDINKRYFQDLEHIIPGFLIVLDINDFSVKYLSSNGLEIIKKDLDEAIQMSIDEIRNYLFPNLVDKMYSEMHKCIQEKRTEFGFYFKARYGEGYDYQWFQASLKPDYANKIVYSVVQPVSINLDHISKTISGFLDKCYIAMHENLDLNKLSPREKEIIYLTTRGLSSGQIAEKLFISIYTVNNHRKNIIKKLGLKSLAEIRNLSSIY
jgi:DNA-binding CsgD family transcriptional regulator